MPKIFELGLTPPPGVAFIQWGDGSIRIRYDVKDVAPIREMLLNLARSLTEQALMRLKEERDAELAKQKMPLTRLEQLTQEMHKLEVQASEEIPEPAITAQELPVTIVSKVIRDFDEAV